MAAVGDQNLNQGSVNQKVRPLQPLDPTISHVYLRRILCHRSPRVGLTASEAVVLLLLLLPPSPILRR